MTTEQGVGAEELFPEDLSAQDVAESVPNVELVEETDPGVADVTSVPDGGEPEASASEADADADQMAEGEGPISEAAGDASPEHPELAALAASLEADVGEQPSETPAEPEAGTSEPELEPGAPEPAAPEPAAPEHENVVAAGFVPAPAAGVPWWPFLAYGALWVVFAAMMVWQLLQTPDGVAAYDSAVYPFTIYGGLGLTVAGPLLLIAAWLLARTRVEDRAGLFLTALVRGSVATLAGVIVWWAVLIAVDYIRLGALF